MNLDDLGRKTNVCLVAGFCVRDFFGWGVCAHSCDRIFGYEMMAEIMGQELARLRKRVPHVVLKKLETRFLGVYIPSSDAFFKKEQP